MEKRPIRDSVCIFDSRINYMNCTGLAWVSLFLAFGSLKNSGTIGLNFYVPGCSARQT